MFSIHNAIATFARARSPGIKKQDFINVLLQKFHSNDRTTEVHSIKLFVIKVKKEYFCRLLHLYSQFNIMISYRYVLRFFSIIFIRNISNYLVVIRLFQLVNRLFLPRKTIKQSSSHPINLLRLLLAFGKRKLSKSIAFIFQSKISLDI